ncbi:DUF3429 domain-containing protein [Minwuia thermotolerans]|uniref:DUF3429 domain-containing protein n=2 Tax=Minwuia thermotolerans TaxID=2056226 RepID=A0A2M9G057_9PROT|nr:DUF3429 domain-containing protein [Minwuia thermotolerans]
MEPAMPRIALILALLGLVPFVGGAVANHVAEGGYLGWARYSMPVYAAVILSFLGGAQWGFALAPGGDHSWRSFRLIAAMVPPVAAWLVLLLPQITPQLRYLILAGCLVLWAVIDHLFARQGWGPDWYPRLRWPVTAAAALSLVAGSQF